MNLKEQSLKPYTERSSSRHAMDRSRRSTSTPSIISKKSVPRFLRRPLALLRSFLSGRFRFRLVGIVLILLGVLATLILRLSSSALYLHSYEQQSEHQRPGHLRSSFATSGSLRELDSILGQVCNVSRTRAGSVRSTGTKKLIVCVAVNYAFRRLALNFVCNLKRLKITNYLVLAMDLAVYQYLSSRDVNVFFYKLQPHRRLLSTEEEGVDHPAKFGSISFVETSRRKSMLVLKVVRLGYSVVFSDVDVVWVQNPIPELLRQDYDFVIQSDRSHADRDAALNYNLNSGFYLVRSSIRTLTALNAILKYAVAIRRSEQKAFNYVLCGAFKDHHAGPGLRIGSNECTYSKSGATATALSLESFPNGSDAELWTNSSASFAKTHPGVIAVHANYVEGRFEKVERIRRIGFWLHSEQSDRIDECDFSSSRK